MTDKFLNATIQKLVQKVFADNQDAIVSRLAASDAEGKVDVSTAELLIKGMMISAEMAVQITLRILEDVGLIETQPDAVVLAQLINDEISKSDNENVSE